MSDKSLSLSKVCLHCGLEKPLTAFLQFSDEKGTHYGTICANCRKTVLENEERQRIMDDVTTTSSGFKIDAKAKVQSEIEKRKLRKELTEKNQKEKEKKETLQIEIENKQQHISKDEKKHRQTFLEKRTFTETKNPAPGSEPIVHGGEEHKAREGKLDFSSGPVDYTRVAGTIKTQSSVFQSFKAWLGANAPIVKATEKATKNNSKPNDPVNEFVNKHFGPKSK